MDPATPPKDAVLQQSEQSGSVPEKVTHLRSRQAVDGRWGCGRCQTMEPWKRGVTADLTLIKHYITNIFKQVKQVVDYCGLGLKIPPYRLLWLRTSKGVPQTAARGLREGEATRDREKRFSHLLML